MQGRLTRRSIVMILAVLALLAVAVPAVMAAKPFNKPTKVTIKKWDVVDANGATTFLAPGATHTRCATVPITEIGFFGNAKRIVEGKYHRRSWLLNGASRLSNAYVWTDTDRKIPYNKSLTNSAPEGFEDGRWTVKIVQKGRTIGRSSINLATNPAC